MDILIIKKIALKYNGRKEFRLKDYTVYNYARKLNLLNEVCSHMEIKGHKYKRFVYAFEFSDNHVYVGITYDLSKRMNEHYVNKESSVFKHISKTGLEPKFINVSKIPLDIEKAVLKEKEVLEYYESKGWEKLNRAKTGGVGGNFIKWTKGSLQEECLKHDSLKSLQRKGKGAYASAVKLGVLYDLCKHMKKSKEIAGFWNIKENCFEESKKYKNISEFKKMKPGAYESCVRNGWSKEFFPNKKVTKPSGYWDNYDNFIREMNIYGDRQNLKKNNESAYKAGIRNNWFN